MTDEAAKFVWKLARRHSWGAPIPAEQLLRLVAGTEDHDELERILEDEVLEFPFVVQSPDGVYIPNGQDTHIDAASWLRKNTGLDDFKIKTTLSRLPEDWPEND